MTLTLSSPAGAFLRPSSSKLSDHSPPKPAVTLSSSVQQPLKPFRLSLYAPKTPLLFVIAANQSRVRVFASVASHNSPTLAPLPTESQSVLTGSTRTVTTVVTLAFSISRLFLNSIQKLVGTSFFPNSIQLSAIRALQSNLVHTAGPLFFAAARGRSASYVSTPLTVVAAGMAKWLDIYSGVLLVRVLLSWFPIIPWDRQPLSAIRDLCDPYLSLFRNIIPPVFGSLDVSPLLAFASLGVLGKILRTSRWGM